MTIREAIAKQINDDGIYLGTAIVAVVLIAITFIVTVGIVVTRCVEALHG